MAKRRKKRAKKTAHGSAKTKIGAAIKLLQSAKKSA